MFVYSLKRPYKYKDKIDVYNHSVFLSESRHFLVPFQMDLNCVNPDFFYKLKIRFNIKDIQIEDRVKDCEKNRCIMDHVNKSGTNFLFNKTPYKNFPTFPDMSKIYNPIPDLEKIIVHTVGRKNFLKRTEKGVFISEMIGLVSPVWHYVGVKVFGKSI